MIQQNNAVKTVGETFLLELQKAESRGLIFAGLEKTVALNYPQYDLVEQVNKLSDFDSVAAYHSKLARIHIEYNSRAINEIKKRLVGLNNIGNDNYKYKEKVVHKLNLLMSIRPTLDDIIYIAIDAYVTRGYGTALSFKRELAEHIKDNAPVGGQSKLAVYCQEDVCQIDNL